MSLPRVYSVYPASDEWNYTAPAIGVVTESESESPSEAASGDGDAVGSAIIVSIVCLVVEVAVIYLLRHW
jgi:hypothetical protein